MRNILKAIVASTLALACTTAGYASGDSKTEWTWVNTADGGLQIDMEQGEANLVAFYLGLIGDGPHAKESIKEYLPEENLGGVSSDAVAIAVVNYGVIKLANDIRANAGVTGVRTIYTPTGNLTVLPR